MTSISPKPRHATIYHTDGTLEEVILPGGEQQLPYLQKAVDGYIEVVHTRFGDIYCNEDGRLIGLNYNRLASAYFNIHLVGEVVHLKGVVK